MRRKVGFCVHGHIFIVPTYCFWKVETYAVGKIVEEETNKLCVKL